jgi:hypothetical protein
MRPARFISYSDFPTLKLVRNEPNERDLKIEEERKMALARARNQARLELWQAGKISEVACESASRILAAVRCRNV